MPASGPRLVCLPAGNCRDSVPISMACDSTEKATPEGIADEKGKYKYEFTLPQEWEGKQIELVFEAVMTDAKVTINGRKAGNGLHQGGFYRFTYDVSDRIFFGKHKNRLRRW